MTSAKEIDANQRNSARSTGPKTRLGKERARLNARKHAVLARELMVNDAEKPDFEALRSTLQDQLSPATPLQRVAFDRILCSFWRCKLAVRLEARRLNVTFDEKKNPVLGDAPAESIMPTAFYAASAADLRVAIRFLSRLRQDVKQNGWTHAEDWKAPVTKAFGEEYFSMLTHWVPIKIDAIRFAEMVTAHAEMYAEPFRPADSKNEPVITDPKLSWQMGVKLIDLMQHHLESLVWIRQQGADPDQEQRASALELATRYYSSATRELERAVSWYQSLKEQGL